MKQNILLICASILAVSFSMAYAESSYDIIMPSGSADPNAPFHWSSEKDGDTSGYIQVIVNDSVVWKNADTVKHTVTSGSPQNGPDGVFDSGDIVPGKWFSEKFTQVGKFPYYCTIHPWRTGLVDVVSGFSVLPRVASDVGNGSTTFDLEYKFNRLLQSASVDEDKKTITFTLQGRTNSENNSLTLLLPSKLIAGISAVSIDGVETEKFSQEKENGITKLVINNVSPSSKEITITGTTIIPEFAEITVIVLIISVSLIILFSKSHVMFARGISQNRSWNTKQQCQGILFPTRIRFFH